jgi:transcription initiation factor TFIIIB Brf1 subunit/transcription initiation factor TFIIB
MLRVEVMSIPRTLDEMATSSDVERKEMEEL